METGSWFSLIRLVKLGIQPGIPGLPGKWFILYTTVATKNRMVHPFVFNNHFSLFAIYFCISGFWADLSMNCCQKARYSKTCVKKPLSKRPKIGFKTNYCLPVMQVKSIAECFLPSLSYHLSMRFPTMWYVLPAKPQITLRIPAV